MSASFRIADTFTDSLARLTPEEQKRAKLTVFDLQVDPKNQGMNLHRLGRIKDKNFWSVRVSDDLRIIVHQSHDSLLVCYVDHHDKAYDWAERRRLDVHPTTGAAQLVEVRELVEEVIVPRYIEVEVPAPPRPKLFASIPEATLLSYGVPTDWLAEVRAADEDSILLVADHLPAEAAEALLEIATGGMPPVPRPETPVVDPFAHPDALRRFRVMHDIEELERALEAPWEKWLVFLHPAQRRLVERQFNGPARVAGSAGTGKTVVALHRAVMLARRQPDARILLATFSDSLANALASKLRLLISNERRAERIEVHSLDALAARLHTRKFGQPNLVRRDELSQIIESALAGTDIRFSSHFLLTEWEQVIDAWQLRTWESYRDVSRLGRKTRLPEKQRAALWSVFERVWSSLESERKLTLAGTYARLGDSFAGDGRSPFDHIVVDEAQDIGVPQLRFLASLAGMQPNGLFFTGDLGQRIFQQGFSWKALGVDVRGRSQSLKVNYRTSHQIRVQADRLLGLEVTDPDGLVEDRRGTVSVFNGPAPIVRSFENEEVEQEAVAEWLKARLDEGVLPGEMAVFVRSDAEFPRARAALDAAGLPFKTLDDAGQPGDGHVSLSTMQLAKGLEFRAVAVMACDEEVIPSESRIAEVVDEADLEEVYDTERQLLYVACTRARDHLLVASGARPSEFLGDLIL